MPKNAQIAGFCREVPVRVTSSLYENVGDYAKTDNYVWASDRR